MQHLNVLGIDPGFKNCGYGAISARGSTESCSIKINAVGLFQKPIQDFKHIGQAIMEFEQELNDMIDLHAIELLVIERFIGRTFVPKGCNPEAISFMVGVAASVAARRGMPTALLSAVQWKNAWQKKGDQRRPLADLYRACSAPPHLVDGVLQARYGAETYFGSPRYWGYRSEFQHMISTEKMLRRIEKLCDPALIRKNRNKNL